MKNLLVTGFDPFGGASVNPAWEAVKLLPDVVGDCRIHKLMIPTVYGKAADTAIKAAEDVCADIVLSIGQAGGRAAVTPELVAINHRNANGADNEGNVILYSTIIENAPAAYFATVPVRDMTAAIKDAGIASAVSYSAGTFVCNDTFYTISHRFDGSGVKVGFIHVPCIPEQVKEGRPSMPLCDIVKAITAAISVL